MNKATNKWLYGKCKDDKGKWWGNHDYDTSTRCFFYDKHNATDWHKDQWDKVLDRLLTLLDARDSNGDCLAQLVFTRDDERIAVVAYRFTSDYAYRKYEHELVQLGSSLGRGTFEPFKPDSDDYNRFIV